MPIERKPREGMSMEKIQRFAPQADGRKIEENTRARSIITKYWQT
jgi:hypothetical protein